MKELLDHLFSYQAAMILLGVWAVLQHVHRISPTFFARPLARRVRHAAAPLLCLACMWIPGIFPELLAHERLFIGLILGLGLDKAHGLLKNTIFGPDEEIDAAPVLTEKQKEVIKAVKRTLT